MRKGFLVGFVFVNLFTFARSAVATTGTTTTKHPVTHGSQLTAEDQSTAPADVETTRKIRAALMKEKLSTSGKNVTIVTREGKVILKGRVAAVDERTRISNIARGIAGADNVTNEIVVQK